MKNVLSILIVVIILMIIAVPSLAQESPGANVPGSLPWAFATGSEELAIDVFMASFNTGLISDYSIEWIDNPDGSESLVLWMKYDHTRYSLLYVRDAILCQLEYMFDGWRNSCPVG